MEAIGLRTAEEASKHPLALEGQKRGFVRGYGLRSEGVGARAEDGGSMRLSMQAKEDRISLKNSAPSVKRPVDPLDAGLTHVAAGFRRL
jgi:hypothetical protein